MVQEKIAKLSPRVELNFLILINNRMNEMNAHSQSNIKYMHITFSRKWTKNTKNNIFIDEFLFGIGNYLLIQTEMFKYSFFFKKIKTTTLNIPSKKKRKKIISKPLLPQYFIKRNETNILSNKIIHTTNS